jgi:hypothetical protein
MEASVSLLCGHFCVIVALPGNPNMWQYKHKRQTSIPRVGFEPAIPATKRPQTYTLEWVATGIGNKLIKVYAIVLWIESCVDGSVFEKVIRHNKMHTNTMYCGLYKVADQTVWYGPKLDLVYVLSKGLCQKCYQNARIQRNTFKFWTGISPRDT